MGSARPNTAADYMFKSDVAKTDGVHPVPVSNFMNAQCEPPFYSSGDSQH